MRSRIPFGPIQPQDALDISAWCFPDTDRHKNTNGYRFQDIHDWLYLLGVLGQSGSHRKIRHGLRDYVGVKTGLGQ